MPTIVAAREFSIACQQAFIFATTLSAFDKICLAQRSTNKTQLVVT